MPQVKNYTRQIRTERAAPAQRQAEPIVKLPIATKQISYSPESQGAGFGSTLAQAGAGITAEVQQVQDQQRDKARAIRMQSERQKLSGLQVTTVNEATKKQGLDAVGAEDQAVAAYQQQAEKWREELPDGDMQAAFDIDVADKISGMRGTLSRHENDQMHAVDTASYKADRQNLISFSMLNSSTPSLVEGQIPIEIKSSIDTLSQRTRDYLIRNGHPTEDVIKAAIDADVSTIHANVIKKQLTEGNDLLAADYYKKVSGLLLGQDKVEVDERLKVGSTDGFGFRLAKDAMLKNKPPDDKTPIEMDAVEAYVDEQLAASGKSDKEQMAIKTVAMSQITATMNRVENSRVQRAYANEAKLYKAWNGGATWDQMKLMPEYIAMPDDKQTAFKHAVEDYGQKLIQIAHGQESYIMQLQQFEWAKQSHAMSLADHQQQQLTIESYVKLQHYLAPANLAKIVNDARAAGTDPEDAVFSKQIELGPTNMGHYLNGLRAYQNDLATAAGSVTVDDETFKRIATRYGYDAYGDDAKRGTVLNAQLGFMKGAVKSAIGKEEADKGKKLNAAEKEIIIENTIKQKVQIAVGSFGRLQQISAAAVRPEDYTTGMPRVNILDITPAQLTVFVNQMKSDNVVPQNMDPKEVIRQYTPRIEFAMAADRIHGFDEARRILREGK